MSDIVERLRRSVTKGHEPTDEDAIEAANEIERLRTWIGNYGETGAWPDEVARALGKSGETRNEAIYNADGTTVS